MEAPSFDDIRAAAARLEGAIERTPCVRSRTLSRLTGAEVFLKFENLQFTASFKERGALNRLLALTPEERRRGVIAMSAGNHAQAVAYHAARLGVRSVIVMPKGSPNTKIRNTADKTMYYGYYVAFFDKDKKLIATSSFDGSIAKLDAGKETNIGNVIQLPVAEIAKIAHYQVTLLEDEKEFGK